MTLADELGKLVSLFQQGLLSAEEFQAAKASAISAASSQPPPSSLSSVAALPPPPQATATLPADAADPRRYPFAPSSVGENVSAFRHLNTILHNLITYPNEAKYRTLRVQNATLSAQLFHVRAAEGIGMASSSSNTQRQEEQDSPSFLSAAEIFLSTVGFVRESNGGGNDFTARSSSSVSAAASASDGTTTKLLRFSLSPPTSPSVESYRILQDGLQRIEEMQRRDSDAEKRHHEFDKLRRSLALEIRLDRLNQAVKVGEEEAHTQQCFVSDPLNQDDEFCGALDAIATLRRVVTNVAEKPEDPRYRRLNLGNRSVHRALVNQCGGLEFLIGIAGFQMSESQVVFAGSSDDATQRMTHALQALTRIEEAVIAERDRIREAERVEALMWARATLHEERLKEQQQHNKQHQVEHSADAEHLSRLSGNPNETNQAEGSRRRVTIEEALKHLLGQE